MNINITAPVNNLGFGVVGLNAVLSLSRQHQVALWVVGDSIEAPQEHHETLAKAMKGTESFDSNAPSLRIHAPADMAHHIGRGIRAALTFFERSLLLPAERHHLNAQDVVIASSAWMKATLVRNGLLEERVSIARPGVDRSIFKPGKKNESETTTFIAVGKWEKRKGHDVLAKAFLNAFSPKDNVKLLLLTSNPFLTKEENTAWSSLFTATGMGENVRVLDRVSSQQEVADLMGAADCGVFISRAEGWNLDLAEMLSMGKHCIATNYSAHTEFVTSKNCMLVDIDREEAAVDGKWFNGYGHWAALGDRQMHQIVSHMRSVHRRKQDGTLSANLAGTESMKSFTWDSFADEIVSSISA